MQFEKNIRKTCEDIANHFSNLWGIEISWRTVNGIKNLDDFLKLESNSKSTTGAKHKNLKKSRYYWFSCVRSQSFNINYAFLLKILLNSKVLNIEDFNCFVGWLDKFKKGRLLLKL